MHVLTVICAGGWMSGNLSEGWRRLGCTVEEFFYGTHMGTSWDAAGAYARLETNQRLLQVAERKRKANQLDLIFCVIYDDVLEVETIKRLRRLNVPIINYHVDLVGQWYRVLRTAKYFDRLACAHEDHWDVLRRAGARPYYLPMAANPVDGTVSSSAPMQQFDGVVYLGSPSTYRREVLSVLHHSAVPLRIYGNNWAHAKRDASNTHHWRKNLHDLRFYAVARCREEGVGELARSIAARVKLRRRNGAVELPQGAVCGRYLQGDFPRIVTSAAINLGFTHFRGTPGTAGEQRQVRLREFEIPMAGGFYLTQTCPQLSSLYRSGEHLETWNHPADLVEKIRHYLSRPAERASIAQRGRQHALQHHTWKARFQGLLRELSM